LADVEKLIPTGLDDASAFRAPGEVQNAWRTLTDAADVADQAISIRSAMCNRAGSAISIDHPEPNVFTADWGGGLRYGLVSNPYALDKAGRWPATGLDFRHRLIALHRAGAVECDQPVPEVQAGGRPPACLIEGVGVRDKAVAQATAPVGGEHVRFRVVDRDR